MKGLLRDTFILPLADNGVEVARYFQRQEHDAPVARQGVHIVHQPVVHDDDEIDNMEQLQRLEAAYRAWKKRNSYPY